MGRYSAEIRYRGNGGTIIGKDTVEVNAGGKAAAYDVIAQRYGVRKDDIYNLREAGGAVGLSGSSSGFSSSSGDGLAALGTMAAWTVIGAWKLGKFGVRKYQERKTAKELEKLEGFTKNPRKYIISWFFKNKEPSIPIDGAGTIFLVEFLPSIPELLDELLDDEDWLEQLSTRDISYENILDCLDIANNLSDQLSQDLDSILHIDSENSGKIKIADATDKELVILLKTIYESFEIYLGSDNLSIEDREVLAKQSKKLKKILNGITSKPRVDDINVDIQTASIDFSQEISDSQNSINCSENKQLEHSREEDSAANQCIATNIPISESDKSHREYINPTIVLETQNETIDVDHRDEYLSSNQQNVEITDLNEDGESTKLTSTLRPEKEQLTRFESYKASDCIKMSSFLAALELFKESAPSKSVSCVSFQNSGMRLFAYALLDVDGNLISNVNNAMIKSRLDRHSKALMRESLDKSLSTKLNPEEFLCLQKILDSFLAKVKSDGSINDKSQSAQLGNESNVREAILNNAPSANKPEQVNGINITSNMDIAAFFLAAVEVLKDSSPSKSLNTVSLVNSGFNLFAYTLRDANGVILANVNSSMVKSRFERHRIAVSNGLLDQQLRLKLKPDELAQLIKLL